LKNNLFNNETKTLGFDDSKNYLEQINFLISKAHEASMDADQDVYDWFFILEELHLEIDGILYAKKDTETIKIIDNAREQTSKHLKVAYRKVGNNIGNLNPDNVSGLRNVVFPYHRLLNRIIHTNNLRYQINVGDY
jgi:hypothetical protein